MDLWVLEDDAAHNALGTALFGALNSNFFTPANGSNSNGSAPFFSGAFGTVSGAGTTTYGDYAQFDATTILATGGTVAGTNTAGQVTVAYWAKGAFAPGSGALILFSDVDMISNWQQNPYSPLNNNGILALNTMAWLTEGAQAIPEPSTFVLMGLGGAALILIGLRRRSARSSRAVRR